MKREKAWMCRVLALGVLLLGTGAPARGAERVLFSAPAGECTLSVAASDDWPALRLRAHHPDHRPCRVEKEDVTRVLSAAGAELPRERVFTSLFIGRLVDYPWLSQHLALRAAGDPGWDARRGKPVGRHVNAYVAAVLSAREVAAPIEEPLRSIGYGVSGVSVEKVLVGGFENVPLHAGPGRKGRVPFDAQVWFRLEKR